MIQNIRQLDDATVVEIAGQLDAASVPDVRAQLQQIISSGQSRVVLDLKDLEFIDSAGLGVLISCLRRCVAAGGDMCLANVPQLALSILELTQLTRVLQIAGSETEAVGILRKDAQ